MDALLGGGYPTGSMVLLEVGKGVSTEQYQLMLAPTTWNFAAHDRGTLIIPSSGVDHNSIKAAGMRGGFTEEEVNRGTRVVILESSPVPREPYLVQVNGKSAVNDYQQFITVSNQLRNDTGRPLCYMSGYDSLIAHYGTESVVTNANLEATRVRERGELSIGILKPGYEETLDRLSSLVDVHLKLIVEDGVLIVFGVKPRTNLYGVEVDTSKGYPLPRLTPIL
jgi:hypothetical protein